MKLFNRLLLILFIASLDLSAHAEGPLKCHVCKSTEEDAIQANACTPGKSTKTLETCAAGEFCEFGRLKNGDEEPTFIRKCSKPDNPKEYCADKTNGQIFQCFCNTNGCNNEICECVDGVIIHPEKPKISEPSKSKSGVSDATGVHTTFKEIGCVLAVILGLVTRYN